MQPLPETVRRAYWSGGAGEVIQVIDEENVIAQHLVG
jgi:hypothetical protein